MDFDGFSSALAQAVMGMVGSLDGWIVVALVLALFTTAAFRPQQIHDPQLFRQAVTILGRYLVVPLVIGLLLLFDLPPKLASVVTSLGLLAGRILLAMSLVQALRSIVPERAASDAGR